MKARHEKVMAAAAAVCGSAVILSVPAAAYIDPATTSYIIQIVVGVVIACGTAAGIIFSKVRRKFRKKNEPENGSGETASPENNSRGGVMTAADLLDDEGGVNDNGADGSN